MDTQFWALAFAILGFCLIVAEFFVPSGGMIALSCAGSFVASVACAYSAWYVSSPKLFWGFTLGLSVLIPSFLVFFLRTLERTSLGNNLLLPKTNSMDVTPYQQESALLDRLIGRLGTAVTPMNPGGMVRVENERLHAICEGILLNQGDQIEVTGVRGNRVLVKRAAPGPVSRDETAIAPTNSSRVSHSHEITQDEERLDFDVPQN